MSTSPTEVDIPRSPVRRLGDDRVIAVTLSVSAVSLPPQR